MERKIGEVFNYGNDLIEVVKFNGKCGDCYYFESPFCKLKKSGNSCNAKIKFIKIGEVKIRTFDHILDSMRYFADSLKNIKGESKMDNREELKRSLAEEEQRAKDSLANVEKMKKQLEELKEEQPTVSATGVYLEEPQKNSTFFANHGDNSIQTENYNFENYEKGCFNVNNVFATKEQAEQEALRREGQEFIRRCAMLWNKDHDWRKKKNIAQFGLYYDTESNKIIHNTTIDTTRGEVNFDTQELAEKCIAELNSKYNNEQQKTIFGVK